MRIGPIWSGTLATLAAFTGATSAANAAGFGPVRSLSPATGMVDQLSVAVGPTGETAVLWRQIGPTDGDFQFVAAIGPDAENLGPAQVVEPTRGRPSRVAGVRLFARPHGGFAACFDGGDHRTVTFGCSFTTRDNRFGPLQVIERRSRRADPGYDLAMRPDGKLAVLLGHRVAKTVRLWSTTLDDQGRLGPTRPFATVSPKTSVRLATTDDGVTAVALVEPSRRDKGFLGRPMLRLTAAGGEVFGNARSVLPRGAVGSLVSFSLDGGHELRLAATDWDDGINGNVIVRRRSNGSFSPPLRLPRPASGFLTGTVVAPPGRAPLAVSAATRESQSDCSNVSAGVVGSGPLLPRPTESRSTTQRLSKPGQISVEPTAATLADGTVIAAWENGVDDVGYTRLEVAVRPAKATRFQPSQVLPELATSGKELAAGGDQAILVWLVGDHIDGPAHVVVSSLRQAPPYAIPARLPKRPEMPCQ